MSYLAFNKSSKKSSTGEKFSADDFVPKRYGLRYDPPMISNLVLIKVMEYMIISTGKLYHHKMKLLNFSASSNCNEMCDYIIKKHEKYIGSEQAQKE
jgi:centrosomal protein CEP19